MEGIIRKWERIEAPKGMYLYNEKKDDLCLATTINVSEEDDWSVVDAEFGEAWKARKQAEEEALAEEE